jgi:predicted DNA-binding transcriptional regulator AlpA
MSAGRPPDYLPPGLAPLAVTRAEAATMIRVGTATFDKLVAAGHLPPAVRIGARLVWDVAALRVAWARFAAAQAPALGGPLSLRGWDDAK